jgi:uncharacterized protein (DUF1330 family)
METAEGWYSSPGYQAAKEYREGAADIDLIFIEGGVVREPERRMPRLS